MEENNNVTDFTAYKMRSIIEDLDSRGQGEYANAVQHALDLYLLGEFDIGFANGWPYVLEDIEDINL